MQRYTAFFFLLLLLCFTRAPVAMAAGFSELDEHFAASGAQTLPDSLPDETRELLSDSFGGYDLGTLLSLPPDQWAGALFKLIGTQVRKPLRILCAAVGSVLLCALLSALSHSVWNQSMGAVFQVVSGLFTVTAVIAPVLACITDTGRIIQECSLFIASFIPVFTSVIAVGGYPVTATTYNLFLFGACQLFSQFLASAILPLLYLFLALCTVSACSRELSLSGVIAGVKSVLTWLLVFAMTLFAAVFSAQTFVSVGTDNVTVKASKFLIGSFVPVIGSVISDALITAQGYLKALKASVGAFGIISVIWIFIPVFLKVAVWMVTVKLAGMAADLMEIPHLATLFKSIGSCMGILISLLVCYAMFLIISIVLVLSFSTA